MDDITWQKIGSGKTTTSRDRTPITIHADEVKFTVRDIPNVMKNKLNWPKSAEVMELWFSLPAKEMSRDEKRGILSYPEQDINKAMFSLEWLEQFERFRVAKSKLLSSTILWSNAAKSEAKAKILKQQETSIDNSSLSVESLHEHWQFQYSGVGYDFGVVDDLYGSLGNFAIYAAISKGYIENYKENKYFIVTEIAIYMRDTFDFIGEQYLGHWNKDGMGISLAGGIINKMNWEWKLPGWNPSLGVMQAFGNKDYREYRDKNGMGGDLLLFSNIQRIMVNERINIGN